MGTILIIVEIASTCIRVYTVTFKQPENLVLIKIKIIQSTVLIFIHACNPGGEVLPQILDRGVPRRFLNPNPI